MAQVENGKMNKMDSSGKSSLSFTSITHAIHFLKSGI